MLITKKLLSLSLHLIAFITNISDQEDFLCLICLPPRDQPALDPPLCFITESQTLLNIYHLIVLKAPQTEAIEGEHGTVPS